jgi:hypothetical protein
MALTMAPATESVMGSLPLAKAGVGSAVNDTTRQVGGALGVAIIGSVLSSTYSSKISDFFANQSARVPPSIQGQFDQAKEAARDSLGGAINVANQLPERGLPLPPNVVEQLSSDLTRVANQAFVDGMHAGVLVAAAATLLGAIVALVWLPARARAENVESQAAEYAAEHHDEDGAGADGRVDLPDSTLAERRR